MRHSPFLLYTLKIQNTFPASLAGGAWVYDLDSVCQKHMLQSLNWKLVRQSSTDGDRIHSDVPRALDVSGSETGNPSLLGIL